MTKKNVFFFLYCAIMIGALILFLILSPKLIQNKEIKDKTGETNSNYATKLKLNCADEIVLSVGSSVELLDNYITVEPQSMYSQVEYTISNKSEQETGISFENNLITANEEGSYSIIFSVKKSEDKQIHDTLKITVVDKSSDTNVKLINNNFTNDTTITINEFLDINEEFINYSISNNQHILYNNNQVQFIDVGNSVLQLNLDNNYLRYYYSFNVLINPKIETSIEIKDLYDGIIQVTTNIEDMFDLEYYFKTDSGEHITQEVTVEIEDETVATLVSNLAPILTFKCLKKSSTKITLASANPNIPAKEFILIFV